MKFPKILFAFILFTVISCDKEDNSEAIAALAGHWHVLSFEPEDSTEISMLTKDVIAILERRGCDPIEFLFKSDGTVAYTNRMSLLSAKSVDETTEVDCIWEGGTRRGTFDFDYEVLTMSFDDESIVYNATLEGENIALMTNTLTLNGQTVPGKLLFKPESGD